MPHFEYKGRNTQGHTVSGVVEAASAEALAGQLLNSGITPIDIDQTRQQEQGPLFRLPQWQSRRPPSLDDLILFSRQFYTLMRAGVPIIRAMAGLTETARNPTLKAALRDTLAELEGGHELSTALSQHPKIFTPLFINMVRVGENSGRLDEIFLRISEYLEREKTTRNQIKSAMRYPTFVIVTIAVALFIINMWVIPTFAKVFSGFGSELPLPTRILLGFSDFTVAWWPYLLFGATAAVFGLRRYVQTETGHYRWDRLKTRIPIIGDIILRATLSRFARAFSMAMRSGVPLVQTLVLVSRAVDNTFIGGHILHMRNGVERGDSLTRTAADTHMFTPLVIQMLAVGEETGAVDELLDEVADFYDREVDYDLKSLTSKIEPILILFIGIMVLILALGVFLPMWDLINVAKSQ